MKAKRQVSEFIKTIDREILCMAFITMLAIAYYVNPLDNVQLTEWNRTFGPAVLAGISIDKRIRNFYFLFLIYLPVIFIVVTTGYAWLFGKRASYKESYTKFNILFLFSIISSYISRYADGSDTVKWNLLILGPLSFYTFLNVIFLLEKFVHYFQCFP